MKKLLLIILSVCAPVLAGIGLSFAQEDNAGAMYTTESVPCPRSFTVNDAEVEGQTYECGVLHVPLNYEAPDDGALEITYRIMHSTSLSPAPDPVIYLSGGPSSSALNEVTQFPGLYQSLNVARQRRDVIVFDQCGAGHSSLLTCGPFKACWV